MNKNDSHKFAAYLFFWIGICLCGIEWERVESKLPAQEKKSYSAVAEYDRKIYSSRAAFEKDREAFLKTICDPEFDGGMVEGRGYECL